MPAPAVPPPVPPEPAFDRAEIDKLKVSFYQDNVAGKTIEKVCNFGAEVILIRYTDGTVSKLEAKLSHGEAYLSEPRLDISEMELLGIVTMEQRQQQQAFELHQSERAQRMRDMATLDELKTKYREDWPVIGKIRE
jgi:hypothetical protein